MEEPCVEEEQQSPLEQSDIDRLLAGLSKGSEGAAEQMEPSKGVEGEEDGKQDSFNFYQ